MSTKTRRQGSKPDSLVDGAEDAVLTLAEAASYLKLPAAEVLRMVREQRLPGREVGTEWRFLKAALQEWLAQPCPPSKSPGIWGAAGSWQNDPYLDEMLKEIYRQRGRPMTEEG